VKRLWGRALRKLLYAQEIAKALEPTAAISDTDQTLLATQRGSGARPHRPPRLAGWLAGWLAGGLAGGLGGRACRSPRALPSPRLRRLLRLRPRPPPPPPPLPPPHRQSWSFPCRLQPVFAEGCGGAGILIGGGGGLDAERKRAQAAERSAVEEARQRLGEALGTVAAAAINSAGGAAGPQERPRLSLAIGSRYRTCEEVRSVMTDRQTADQTHMTHRPQTSHHAPSLARCL
jgi:hypothetical protein